MDTEEAKVVVVALASVVVVADPELPVSTAVVVVALFATVVEVVVGSVAPHSPVDILWFQSCRDMFPYVSEKEIWTSNNEITASIIAFFNMFTRKITAESSLEFRKWSTSLLLSACLPVLPSSV